MKTKRSYAAILVFILIFSTLVSLFMVFRESQKVYQNEGQKINVSGRQRKLNQKHLKQVLLVKEGLTSVDSVYQTREHIKSNLEKLCNVNFSSISEKTIYNNIGPDILAKSILENKRKLNEYFILADTVLNTPLSSSQYGEKLNTLLKKGEEVNDSLEKTVSLYVDEYRSEISLYNRWIVVLFFVLGILSVLDVYLFFKLLKNRDELSTEVLKRELAEKKQQEYLTKLEKINEDLSQFAYITSHDLKSPLQNMSGLASLLEEDIKREDYSNIKEYFLMFRQRLSYMFYLINGILEYSKIEVSAEQEEPLVVQSVIEESVKVASDKSSINLIFETSMPEIKGSKVKLLQVFSNLISNSVKYNDKETLELRIAHNVVNGEHLFSIKDNGPGIPYEKQKSIFGLFERATDGGMVSGTGVGLFIVDKIIKENKCRIWLESDGKNGSRFFFTWPKN